MYSAIGTPLMMGTPERRRGIRLSEITSERAGTSTGTSAALRLAAIFLDRSCRALRSAAFLAAIASGLSGAGPSPFAAMMSSINRKPSSITCVVHVAVVGVGEIVLDVRAGECGTAEQHRILLRQTS